MFALFLSACDISKTEPTLPEDDDTYGIYQLTFHEKLISNDHVGSDWTITYTHNGQTIKSGHELTQSLEIFTFQTIGVEIRENGKINDVGTGTFTVAICDGGSGKTTVTITETDGKFKGHAAVWEITYAVELVGKIIGLNL